MPKWYDDAEDELCEAVNNGEITEAQYREEIRNLDDELRGQAEEAASQAYDDAMW